MGQRRDRLDKRLANQTLTRRSNSQQKNLASDRRKIQMIAILKAKGPEGPFTPGVMSWVSSQLGKKTSQIQSEDIKTLIS
jgi:hypothetical protein